ncbi:hypothetical protein S40288_10640 [Stachybotrys chartarum IBT 40288]|nr:hypothetical protein S40288_10640 [Stachybotrys chartarum IBT 40288]
MEGTRPNLPQGTSDVRSLLCDVGGACPDEARAEDEASMLHKGGGGDGRRVKVHGLPGRASRGVECFMSMFRDACETGLVSDRGKAGGGWAGAYASVCLSGRRALYASSYNAKVKLVVSTAMAGNE